MCWWVFINDKIRLLFKAKTSLTCSKAIKLFVLNLLSLSWLVLGVHTVKLKLSSYFVTDMDSTILSMLHWIKESLLVDVNLLWSLHFMKRSTIVFCAFTIFGSAATFSTCDDSWHFLISVHKTKCLISTKLIPFRCVELLNNPTKM